MRYSKISVAGFATLSRAALIPLPVVGGGISIGLPTLTLPSILPPLAVTSSTTTTTTATSTRSATSSATPSSILDPLLQFVPNTLSSADKILEGKLLAKTSSPTSNVKGLKFDRFVQIWLENTDFESAMADPNLAWLAQQGISLTNYYGVAHPSQPNYAAVAGGSQNRVISGAFSQIPSRLDTIIDRLDSKGISWGLYQEGLPYSGFLGDYKNPLNGRNNYVRKHNPLASYKSVTENLQRLSQIKNFTLFEQDLAANKLPQWMFITPNMTNDGHDSSVAVAGSWARRFVEPLLTNKNFMQNTLVILTFDESERYDTGNQVYAVLLGDAINKDFVGINDTQRYNHFSSLVTVQQNWGLDKVQPLGVGENNANAFYPFQHGPIVIQDNFAPGDVPNYGADIPDIVGDVTDAVISG